MFDLNPLHLPNAGLQHGIMLLVAGTLGFIIGYISCRGTLAQLEGDLASTNRELADYQRTAALPGPNVDDQVILNRIRARAGGLDFDRLGFGSPTNADDLKEIVGIGPFLERKLNALGIYTFRQISRFTPEDSTNVNGIIEFFPGRIERDDWVGQATELARRA